MHAALGALTSTPSRTMRFFAPARSPHSRPISLHPARSTRTRHLRRQRTRHSLRRLRVRTAAWTGGNGCDALDIPGSHVARGEHTGQTRLEQVW
jgi:hypothetical protein